MYDALDAAIHYQSPMVRIGTKKDGQVLLTLSGPIRTPVQSSAFQTNMRTLETRRGLIVVLEALAKDFQSLRKGMNK